LTYQDRLIYCSMTTATHDELMLRRFQAMAEATRLRIVRMLAGGERCVCDLQADLGAAQSRLSFHLKRLKDAGVVSDRRDGRWIYYSLVPGVLEDMRGFLGQVHPGESDEPGASGESGESGCCCGGC
jgi:ArsR family transcriptional regulator, arsenate/arsenite/antimonite-responsive transcriptional repressor